MRASLACLLAFSSLVCLSASTCSVPGPGGAAGGKGLSILSYNVHNLFDAVDDGTEYDEFSVARGAWDEGRYRSRLAATAEAIRAALPDGAWPDLLCLEEVENRRVLGDLAAGPLKAGGYRHAAMAPAAGSPVNCGLLSRLPIAAIKAHALAPTGSAAAPTRSLLEARIDAGRSGELTVFVLHWKSRVEGARETEAFRREAAALLAGRIAALLDAEPGAALLACGDFNESPDEFLRVGRRYPTALMPELEAAGRGPHPPRLLVAARPGRAGRLDDGEIVLYSPWAEAEGYSYSYRGGRERLDGFLLSEGLLDGRGLDLRSFSVVDAPFLLGPSGEPAAWSPASARGYSDHLPVLLVLGDAGI